MSHLTLLRGPLLILAGGVLFGGCSDERLADPREGTMVRDSLGVELVENLALDVSVDAPVRVGNEPIMVIGGQEDAAGYDLFRVSGAGRFSDGGVAIGNASTAEVRLFDPDGSYRGAVGGLGEGPGEFRNIGSLTLLPGDTLLVFDPSRNARVRFARDGSLISDERSNRGGPSFVEAYLIMADGSRVVRGYDPTVVSHDVRAPQRTLSPIIRISSEGSQVDTIAIWPGRDLMYLDAGPVPAGQFGRPVVARPLFQAESVIAGDAGSGVWVVGDQREPYFQMRTSEGELLRHVRWVAEARDASPDDQIALREERLGGAGEMRAAIARAMEAFPDGSKVPIFRRMVVDREGRVWIERYPLPSDDAQVWWIFSSDGRWMGSLRPPQVLEPLEIGSDYLLSRHRDEWDVERIVAWPLIWEDH